MKSMKNIVIAAVIVILIIIILIIAILKIKNEGTNINDNTVFEQQIEYETDEKLKEVTNRNKYFAVEKIFNSYFSYIEELNGEKKIMYEVSNEKELQEIKKEQQENGIKVLTNMICNEGVFAEYKQANKIIQEGKKYSVYTPFINQILMSEKSASINIYIVKAKLGQKDIKIAIKTDSENMTYSIMPESMIVNKSDSEIINLVSDKEIIKNEYNTYNYKNITDEYMAKTYFNNYIKLVQQDVEVAYKTLDEEYAQKRFGSLENYQKYINKNIETIKELKIKKYQVGKFGENTQYICIDSENNYYVFREKAVLKYSLLLDTYTVDLPEYIEKYNKSNEQQKVAYCIDKFTQAIKDKNYTFAYNLLSEGFKNTYFKTEDVFEKYVEKTFAGKTEISYNSFKTEGNIYTYDVIFKNEKDDTQVIQKTFIVKLNKGTDFEMSFNIK